MPPKRKIMGGPPPKSDKLLPPSTPRPGIMTQERRKKENRAKRQKKEQRRKEHTIGHVEGVFTQQYRYDEPMKDCRRQMNQWLRSNTDRRATSDNTATNSIPPSSQARPERTSEMNQQPCITIDSTPERTSEMNHQPCITVDSTPESSPFYETMRDRPRRPRVSHGDLMELEPVHESYPTPKQPGAGEDASIADHDPDNSLVSSCWGNGSAFDRDDLGDLSPSSSTSSHRLLVENNTNEISTLQPITPIGPGPEVCRTEPRAGDESGILDSILMGDEPCGNASQESTFSDYYPDSISLPSSGPLENRILAPEPAAERQSSAVQQTCVIQQFNVTQPEVSVEQRASSQGSTFSDYYSPFSSATLSLINEVVAVATSDHQNTSNQELTSDHEPANDQQLNSSAWHTPSQTSTISDRDSQESLSPAFMDMAEQLLDGVHPFPFNPEFTFTRQAILERYARSMHRVEVTVDAISSQQTTSVQQDSSMRQNTTVQQPTSMQQSTMNEYNSRVPFSAASGDVAESNAKQTIAQNVGNASRIGTPASSIGDYFSEPDLLALGELAAQYDDKPSSPVSDARTSHGIPLEVLEELVEIPVDV